MRPIYSSSIKTGKHTDPVWQVFWQAEDLAKELNFFSISSDGRVANWIMSKNELKMEIEMDAKDETYAQEDYEQMMKDSAEQRAESSQAITDKEAAKAKQALRELA